MMKILIFLFTFFFSFSISNADFDFNWWEKFSYTAGFTYPSFVDNRFFSFSWSLYLDKITCSNPAPSLTGSWLFDIFFYKKGFVDFKDSFIYQLPFKDVWVLSVPINSFLTGGFVVSYRPLVSYTSPFGYVSCTINWTLFDNIPDLKENTNTWAYEPLIYKDNFWNYWFNKEYSLWQNFFFYGIFIVVVWVYLFFKFTRFILDLFFKR